MFHVMPHEPASPSANSKTRCSSYILTMIPFPYFFYGSCLVQFSLFVLLPDPVPVFDSTFRRVSVCQRESVILTRGPVSPFVPEQPLGPGSPLGP